MDVYTDSINSILKSKEFATSNRYKDPVEASQNFLEQISKRRSVRQFSSRSVEREIYINAIQAAGTAPSGANKQPWFFALITSQSIKDQIKIAAEEVEKEFYEKKASEEWLSDLKPLGTNNQKPYLSIAPALIAVFSRNFCEGTQGTQVRSYYPIESTGIATGLLITALHLSGLGTLTHTPKPMFFLNKILGLDQSYRPFMIIVSGYPQEPLNLPDINRKPLEQIMGSY